MTAPRESWALLRGSSPIISSFLSCSRSLDVIEVALSVSDVQLPGPCDLLIGIEQSLLPLREPTRRAADREEHREHLDREAHRLIDEPGVEVHVRIELVAHEVVVFERDLLELERDVEQRIPTGDLEYVVGDLLD